MQRSDLSLRIHTGLRSGHILSKSFWLAAYDCNRRRNGNHCKALGCRIRGGHHLCRDTLVCRNSVCQFIAHLAALYAERSYELVCDGHIVHSFCIAKTPTTAHTRMPVLQSMAEQKAASVVTRTLLVHFFVFLVEAVIIFLLVRYVASSLFSK